MTSSHLSHSELSTPDEMAADARHATRALHLERVVRAASRPAPGLTFEEYPREVRKRDIPITAAAARLAGALHLHLD